MYVRFVTTGADVKSKHRNSLLRTGFLVQRVSAPRLFSPGQLKSSSLRSCMPRRRARQPGALRSHRGDRGRAVPPPPAEALQLPANPRGPRTALEGFPTAQAQPSQIPSGLLPPQNEACSLSLRLFFRRGQVRQHEDNIDEELSEGGHHEWVLASAQFPSWESEPRPLR